MNGHKPGAQIDSVQCVSDGGSPFRLYWGDLHNHNAVGYAKGSLQRSIDLAREHLDFFAFTGHASWHDMPEMPGDRHMKWVHGFKAHTNHWSKTQQMIREAVQRGVYLNPTMGYELGSQSSMARKHEDLMYELFRDGALMAYYPENLADGSLLKFRSIRNFSNRHENLVPLAKLSPGERQAFSEAYRLSGEFVKRWVQAGGKVMGGTDDPFPGATGFNQHMEMAMLVEVGLTPMQALKAMTIWGAEVMTARRKVPTQPAVGFIGPGAFADIVVLGANPLDDIDNTRAIERVMKGGQFIRLGYTADYTRPQGVIRAIPSTPEPEISGITPNAVGEGNPEFDMTVEGVGFISDSIVRVDGVSVPTTFVNIRTLKARIPASVVARALPNRFNEPGPFQLNGVYGDRTVKITVFNRPPDGGTSNSVSLRVQARWLRGVAGTDGLAP